MRGPWARYELTKGCTYDLMSLANCCTARAISLRPLGPSSALGEIQPRAMESGMGSIEGVEAIWH